MSPPPIRWAVWCVLGLAVRVAALVVLHDQAFIPDHLSYLEWSQLAVERGPLTLYSGRVPDYRIYSGTNAHATRMLVPQPPIPKRDETQVIKREAPNGQPLAVAVPAGQGEYEYAVYHPPPFNYPPLTAYLYWLLGFVHRALDPTQQADTRLAHFLFATPSIVCDLLLALLVARSLHHFGGAITPEWGLCLTLFCPALIWDSAVWLQTDSVPMVFIVGTFLLLARGRLLAASVVCGVGLMVKPQVAWAVPLVAYMAARRGSLRMAVRSAVAGVAPVLLTSLPFLLSSGLLWFKVAYLGNLSLYPRLTMSAYNPWWIVAGVRAVLHTGPTISLSPAPLISALFADDVPWFWGLTPRAIGGIALAGAFLLIFAAWRRYTRVQPRNVFVLGYLIYLAAFLFPTEVHARYIIYALPLAVVAATQLRSVRVGLWGLNVVCFVNLTGYVFFTFPDRESGIGPIHWVIIGMLLAVIVGSMLLFATPVVAMWQAANKTEEGIHCVTEQEPLPL